VLVLATDGATEVLVGSQEIIPLVQNEEEPADKLVKEAIKRKSEDNNPVIVIKLKN
jgi:serine/threonine protein phosphatase PrpC